jgi:hypothetical protein
MASDEFYSLEFAIANFAIDAGLNDRAGSELGKLRSRVDSAARNHCIDPYQYQALNFGLSIVERDLDRLACAMRVNV